MRRAARTDDNQTEIVALFRKLGWAVLIVAQLKKCCDLVVSKDGRTICIEVKDGKKIPSAQKLTPGEEEFRDRWQGEYKIVNCENDVIEINKQNA
jgi:Holliday junction resolvase